MSRIEDHPDTITPGEWALSDLRAAQDVVREHAFDLLQPFVNAGTETPPEVARLTGAMFALINAAWEIEAP